MFTRRRKLGLKMTRKQHISKLKHLYPSCQHDKKGLHYEGHKITYGEMEYEGIQTLYQYIHKQYPTVNCFMDIGSGRGKLCMYMAAQPKISRVVGIELVKERHDDALSLQRELKSDFSDKVSLLNQNIFDVQLSEYKSYHTFIWFSNLCFDPSTTYDIFKKIQSELAPGTIVCCSKIPHEIGTLVTTLNIPMSWSQQSTVYMYVL